MQDHKYIIYISPTNGAFSEYDKGFISGIVSHFGNKVKIVYISSQLINVQGVDSLTYFPNREQNMPLIGKLKHYLCGWINTIKYLSDKTGIAHINYAPLPIIDNFFIYCLRRKFKIYLTPHDIIPFNHEKAKTFGRKYTYNIVDKIVVHTKWNIDDLVNIKKSLGKKVVLIKHGVPIDKPQFSSRNEAKKSLGILNDFPCVMFFGTIKKEKGLDVFVESLAKLDTLKKQLNVIIAGEDIEHIAENILRTYRHELAKKNINLYLKLERVSDLEKHLFFLASDVVVLPYKLMYASGILKDCINYCVPVIVSGIGELKDTVSAYNIGEVFEAGNSASLARRLESILFDEFKIKEYKRNMMRARNDFRWENVVVPLINDYAGNLFHI